MFRVVNRIVLYRGTSLGNSLPKEIRDISSLDSFKKQIMSRAFYKFLENN